MKRVIPVKGAYPDFCEARSDSRPLLGFWSGHLPNSFFVLKGKDEHRQIFRPWFSK